MPSGENGTRRIRGKFLASIALLAVAGCEERPSDQECRAMADHIVELERSNHRGRAAELAQRVARQRHQALRDLCLDAGTRDEVRCVLEAQSLDALPRCAPR